MPKVFVKKLRGKYRVVDEEDGRVSRTIPRGKARDGGGHTGKAKAKRQEGYINEAYAEKFGK